MSGLKEIRKLALHKLNPCTGSIAGLHVSELQQFAMGYVSLPDDTLKHLAYVLWDGRKKYVPETDKLVDLGTAW